MNGLNTSDSEYKGLIENAFQHLENFKQTYTNSAITHKKKLISSIFPEKIEFDGKKCRTTRINDVLRYILQIDKELGENKKGQISKNMSLSRVVETPRLTCGFSLTSSPVNATSCPCSPDAFKQQSSIK